MHMPSRSLRRQRAAALVAAAGLIIAIIGEVLNIHQIVAVAYIGLTAGVVGLIITSTKQAAIDQDAADGQIEARAFATALDILTTGELDRAAPTRNSRSS